MARDSLDLVTRGARRLRLRRPGARANSAGAGPPGGCLEPTGRARKDFVVAARDDLGRGALGDSEGRATAPIGGKPGGHRRGRAASQDRMLRISSPKPERTPRPTLGQGGGATARRAPHRRAVGALQSLLDGLLGVGPRVAGRGGQAGPMVPCWSTITRCGSTSGSRVASGGSTASRPGTLERDPPSLPRWPDSARRGSPLALAALEPEATAAASVGLGAARADARPSIRSKDRRALDARHARRRHAGGAGSPARPSRTASAAAWTRVCTPSFSKICVTCTLAVLGLI